MIMIMAALAFVVLCVCVMLMEVWHERDWPRHTWIGAAISLGFLILFLNVFG